MNTVHFNVVSGAAFTGKNLEAVAAKAAEQGYKSPKWISFGGIKTLDAFDGASLRGKGARCLSFPDGKPVGYSVFNIEEIPSLELKGLKTKAAKAAPKKATKKVTKKAAKAATKPSKKAPIAPSGTPEGVAIPIKGEEGAYLLMVNGVYTKVHL
jgi:hypothetical protein